MSRERAKPGHSPYVKHVQVRPCDSTYSGTAHVNIAGFEFELIEQAGPATPQAHTSDSRPAPEPVQRPPAHVRQADDGSESRQHQARALARAASRPDVVRAHEEAARTDSDDEGGSDGGGGFDLAKLHRLMRGKYVAAIILSLIFAGAGVFTGIKFGHPVYQSTGLVNILTQTVMYETPEKRNTSSEELVRTAAAKFASQEIILRAMETEAWRTREKPRADETETEFTKSLQIAPDGQLIIVKFMDRNADHAHLAVQAIMQVFKSDFDERQTARNRNAINALTNHSTTLVNDLKGKRNEIADIAGEFGPAGLRAERDFLAVELRRLEMQTQDLELQSPNAVIAEAPLLNDRYLQQLEDRKFDLKSRLAQLDATGVGVQMRQHVETEALIKNVEHQIEDRKNEIAAELAGPTAQGSGPATQSASSVALKKDRLTSRSNWIKDKMRELSKQIAKIDGLQVEERRLQQDLETAQENKRQRELEKRTYDIDITEADVPKTPVKDTRIALSVGGGLGGIVLGFGLMALLGLMDRRVLDPSDTMSAGPRYPILGILPQLPENLSDAEETAKAAHGVHEIRNRLQLASGRRMDQVFAVTGSAAGSGKTSLSIGLGISFAAGGFKTLIVDADLVGGGLSSRVTNMARRKLGQLLLDQGMVSPDQLDEALSHGRSAGRRVGETLVQLGYVAEADLLAVLKRQSLHPLGVLDAMAGEELSECAVATGIDNLWAITLGRATPADAGMISGAVMQQFIDRARQRFEIILLDSGPVPGSIEASIAAAHADAVVLVVARGDTLPYVERSIAYLRELPVRFAGLVFNRARKRDLERYGSSRVSSAGSLGPQKVEAVNLPDNLRFGPIPRSVVARSVRPGEQFRSN